MIVASLHQGRPETLGQPPQRRGIEQLIFGDDVHRPADGGLDSGCQRREVVGIGAVHDDRGRAGVVVAQLRDRDAGRIPEFDGGAEPRPARSHAVEHQHDCGTQVGGDAAVHRELRRRAHPGVVAAEHQQRVARLLELRRLGDDAAHRDLGIGMHPLVVDPDAGRGGAVRRERVEHRIRLFE
jgi:hypothetical protein